MEIKPFGYDSKLCHVFFFTSRVAAYEVGDYLLTEVFFAVDAVEDALELAEELERRLAHELEHSI